MPRDPKKISGFVVYDTETGGFDAAKDALCSIAAIAVHGTTLEEIVKYSNIIKPYDDSLNYSAGAEKVHGLSKDKLMRDGIPLSQAMNDFCQVCKEANIFGTKTALPVLVAHNATFDLGFLMEAARRCKIDLSKFVRGTKLPDGTFVPFSICTMLYNQQMMAEITDTDTNFKLASCCGRAGIELTDAHDSLNDSMATTDLLKYMVTRLRSGSDVTVSEGKATVHRKSFEWA
jgi:ribonuclease T